MKCEKNSIILPKNSPIIVQVKDIQKSGFIELEATGAVINGNEYVLPEGAIAILLAAFTKSRCSPKEMGSAEIEAFLTDLAVNQKVAASTQNQALHAVLFLYKHVLK